MKAIMRMKLIYLLLALGLGLTGCKEIYIPVWTDCIWIEEGSGPVQNSNECSGFLKNE